MNRVLVEFTFKGWVDVDSNVSMTEAKEIVKTGFGVTIDTPNANDDRIINWDIDTHPDKAKYTPYKLALDKAMGL